MENAHMSIQIMDARWRGDELLLSVCYGDEEASSTVVAEFVWDPWHRQYDVVLSPPQREHEEELAAHAYKVWDKWLKNRV